MSLESNVSGFERESGLEGDDYYNKQVENARDYLRNHGRMYARDIARELVREGYRERLEAEHPDLVRIVRMGGL